MLHGGLNRNVDYSLTNLASVSATLVFFAGDDLGITLDIAIKHGIAKVCTAFTMRSEKEIALYPMTAYLAIPFSNEAVLGTAFPSIGACFHLYKQSRQFTQAGWGLKINMPPHAASFVCTC